MSERNFVKEEFYDYNIPREDNPEKHLDYCNISKCDNMSEDEKDKIDGFNVFSSHSMHKIDFYDTLEKAITSSGLRADLITFELDSEEEIAEAKSIVDRLMKDKDYRDNYGLSE